MITKSDIYIIIPCFNEQETIKVLLQEIIALGYHQIIVVDDGSEQNILSIIEDLPIFYIKHPINLGQGAALQTGMDFARNQGAEIVVHIDADGQHIPNDLAQIIQPILNKEVDVVIGSRFMKLGEADGIPVLRKYVLKLAKVVNKIFTGLWFTDAHNGFRALNKKALHCIQLKEPRMAYATEILQQIKKHQLSIKEVPVRIRYTAYSTSKGQSNWNAINILIDLIKRQIL